LSETEVRTILADAEGARVARFLQEPVAGVGNAALTFDAEQFAKVLGGSPEAMKALEAQCRRFWDSDSEIRAEFGNRFEWYACYKAAESRGLVKAHAPALR
jgi:hypothetical protein